MDSISLIAMRREKDTFMKEHPQSPLSPEQQARFTHLPYYEPNPALDLIVQVEPVEGDHDIQIETTSGTTRTYTRFGRFTFSVDGVEAMLTIYEAPHGYFLPFVDANAGLETYSGGRYLEPEELPGGKFHVDFNQAYNPYCAYAPGWSCPIPPYENRIEVAIRAGEKLPEGDWVEVG
ncbi:MAG: DUF1684 domain-containing protein [Anaerolinea sp.]|nr:DUF1684 domain-containing protein [Anaerolinea sp.]